MDIYLMVKNNNSIKKFMWIAYLSDHHFYW